MKISVSAHAIDEAVKDFRVNRKVAEDWIRSNFRKARHIADVIAEDGNPGRLFAGQHITFILDAQVDRVVTVYPSDSVVSTIRTKVESLVTRELRKIERKESATVKRNQLSRLELNVERAACLLRAEKTRSQSVKLAMQARIAAIDEYLTQLNEDIEKIRHEKRKIAKAVAAYIV